MPAHAEQALLKALAVRADDRFESIDAFQHALRDEKVPPEPTPEPPDPSPPNPSPPKISPKTLLLIVSGEILALLAITALIWITNQSWLLPGVVFLALATVVYTINLYRKTRQLDTPVPTDRVRLLFLNGQYADYEDELLPGTHDCIVLGRDPQLAQIIFSSNEVSREHVEVRLTDDDSGTVVVKDLDSTHGTYFANAGSRNGPAWRRLDGQLRIGPQERQRFVFRLGKTDNTFCLG